MARSGLQQPDLLTRPSRTKFEGDSLASSAVESGWGRAMIQSKYSACWVAIAAMLFGIGLTWGAGPPTLEELAAAIERVRTGPDGERVVVGHISRKLAVSVEVLRAQHAQTRLGWGELLIANLLSQATKLTVDQVIAEFRSSKGWADIAHNHNVGLDQLIQEVQRSQQAMAQRAEDRAPPRTSESQSSPATAAPTTVVPALKGPSPRY